jgi:hypothetical protein
LRNEPDVLAVTRSESGPVPNALFKVLSTTIVFALFFAGPSSPSVPSSYPDVLPSTGFFLGLPRGRPVGGFFLGARFDVRLDGLEDV